MMNKNTLRNGDMVVTNNNKKATYMVVCGTPIFRYHTDKGSFSYVDKYSDDLVHPTNDNYSVKEVYRVSSTVDPKYRNDAIFNPDKMAEYGLCIARRGDTTVPVVATSANLHGGGYDIESLDDTQTGDMIEFANGKFATVFRDMPNGDDCVRFHTDTNSFMPFSRFVGLDHFKRPEYKIVRVYRADTSGFGLETSKMFDVIGNPDKMTEYGDIVYDNNVNDEAWLDATLEDFACDDCDTKKALLEALGATVNTINKLLEKIG